MMTFMANSWLALLLTVTVGYLLGSINWAIIVTREVSHKDIRDEGSGNAGATNVLRSHGVLPAVLTSIGDLAKSALAVAIGYWLLTHLHLGTSDTVPYSADTLRVIGGYLGGFAAILGHVLPIFYGFRGGKGVLTTLGMFLVLDWRVALICLGIFVVIVAICRMVSLGSVIAIGCGIILVPLFTALVEGYPNGLVVFCTLFACLVEGIIVIKHKDNLRRIAAGTERRLGEGKGQ